MVLFAFNDLVLAFAAAITGLFLHAAHTAAVRFGLVRYQAGIHTLAHAIMLMQGKAGIGYQAQHSEYGDEKAFHEMVARYNMVT